MLSQNDPNVNYPSKHSYLIYLLVYLLDNFLI